LPERAWQYRLVDSDPYAWAAPRPERPIRRSLTVAALVLVVLTVAGGPLGVLWHFLAPTVPVINAGDGRVVVNDPSPEEYIASDGWFSLLCLAFGVLVAIAAWMVLRRDRGPWLLAGVILGTLAAPVVAWQAGRLIGLGAYQDWKTASAAGATYDAPPDVHAYGALLVAAFAAAIVLTLMAGWSNDPDLDAPGAKPGYGNDLAHADFSSGWPVVPDRTVEPAPPARGPAAPPHG
jgi:hypothetical protein